MKRAREYLRITWKCADCEHMLAENWHEDMLVPKPANMEQFEAFKPKACRFCQGSNLGFHSTRDFERLIDDDRDQSPAAAATLSRPVSDLIAELELSRDGLLRLQGEYFSDEHPYHYMEGQIQAINWAIEKIKQHLNIEK
jgi:hypothetical protein